MTLSTGVVLRVYITHANPGHWSPGDARYTGTNAQKVLFYETDGRGGTLATVCDATGKPLGQGRAVLSEEDTFDKHKGVQIALARALTATGFPKEVRTEIWDMVFAHKYGPAAGKCNPAPKPAV